MSNLSGHATGWLSKFVRVAPLALATALADWALKLGAVISGQPIELHWFRERHFGWLVVVAAIVLVGVISAAANSRLAMVGFGVVLGGVLGNLVELAVFGRVTDFIPFPPGLLSAPADLFALAGYLVFWAGFWRERQRRSS